MLLPQEHTVLVRQTSKWGQLLLLTLVGVGATAFLTALVYRLDEVITVPGKLVPQKGGVEIKSPASGKLTEILVKNGEKVEANETLIRFDIKDQAKITKLRIESLERNIALKEKIISKLIPLIKSGAISELQILQEENSLASQKDELLQLKAQESKLRRESIIKSPIAGVIFDLKPDNDQYVVQNAESLLKIVPSGDLSAEVVITNKDIGFIREGQEVTVRVDSFPFTEYGAIDGEIIRVGADALPPNNIVRDYHFPVSIKLKKSQLQARDGTPIKLQSGMTISTNLKLRDRRLIELLSDLFTNRGESLKRLRQP